MVFIKFYENYTFTFWFHPRDPNLSFKGEGWATSIKVWCFFNMFRFSNSQVFLLDRPSSQGDIAVFLAFIDEIESVVQPLLYSDDAIDILILVSPSKVFYWSELEDRALQEICWEVNMILECHGNITRN
jgi:hypothetical protein